MSRKKIDFDKGIPFIKKRCAHLSENEIHRVEERFRQYVQLIIEIHETNKMRGEEESNGESFK